MIKKIDSSNFLLFLSIKLATGISYLLTVSQRLTWANFGNDGGDFLAAILTGGIPHPTGYPTYTIFGILFQNIPIGDPYFRVVMLSWLPAAISAGLLALWIRSVLQKNKSLLSIPIAIIVGIVWGLMPFLWSQAVIVEVHALQSLFLVLTLWWVWLLWKNGNHLPKSFILILLAFCYGLALGNHITILMFLPVVIYSFYVARKNNMTWGLILRQFFALMLGLLVYLYLPIRAVQFPAINWGNPQTWQGFWWVVSGDPYQNLLAATSVSHGVQRISALAGLLLDQFGYFGVILGVIGAVQYNHQFKRFPWIFIYLFFAFSTFAILYGTDDSIAYLLTPFLVYSVWIGLGLVTIAPLAWRKIPIGHIVVALFSIVVLIRIPETIQDIDPRQQTQPAEYAEYLMQQLPENALVLTSTDRDSFPLWYYHYGLKQRQDLKIIVLPLTQFRWYQETIIMVYPQLEFPELISQVSNNSQSWGEKISSLNPDLPVCKSSLQRNQVTSIQVLCSGGQNYNFVISEE